MMHGREFIEVADTLLTGSGEAEYRSAVSRAYYAAFHTAKGFVESLGFHVPRAAKAHDMLSKCLSNCGESNFIVIGGQLNSLRTQRNDADYKLYLDTFRGKRAKENSTKEVLTAKRIIRKIDDVCLSKECRRKIREGIKAYSKTAGQGWC